jgi:hypothetical protein
VDRIPTPIATDGFEFPVPISDTGTGIFYAEVKAIQYMRWIRNHLEVQADWEKERQAHAQNLADQTGRI